MIKDQLILAFDDLKKIRGYTADSKKHVNKLSIMREKSIIDIFFVVKHDLNKIDELTKKLERVIEEALQFTVNNINDKK